MATPSMDIGELAPEFLKLNKELLFGDIWERKELSKRDKSLITVTVLASLKAVEQIDYHLNFAMENGLTKQELVAALTHIAFYAGWPSAFTGLTHLQGVLNEKSSAKK